MIAGRVGSAGGGLAAIRSGWVTSGDISPIPAAVAFTEIPGSPSFAVPAVAGDFVELQLSFMAQPVLGTFLDTGVKVGGNLVRFASSGTVTPAVEGDPSLYNVPGTYRTSGYAFGFQATADDLSGGQCTVVFASKGNAAGTLYASNAYPLRWIFRNYGSGLTT